MFSFFRKAVPREQAEPAVPEQRTHPNPATSYDLRDTHVMNLVTVRILTEQQAHYVTRGLALHVPVGSVNDKKLLFIVEQVGHAVKEGHRQALERGVYCDGKGIAEEAAADLAQRMGVPSHAEHFGITSGPTCGRCWAGSP